MVYLIPDKDNKKPPDIYVTFLNAQTFFGENNNKKLRFNSFNFNT